MVVFTIAYFSELFPFDCIFLTTFIFKCIALGDVIFIAVLDKTLHNYRIDYYYNCRQH